MRRCKIFARRSFWKSKAARTKANFEIILKAAREYVSESLMDRPAGTRVHGYEPDYYSDAAFYCGTLGREYGYSPERVMALPFKCLFQLVNEIKQYHIPKDKLVQINPLSSAVVNNYLVNANANRKN